MATFLAATSVIAVVRLFNCWCAMWPFNPNIRDEFAEYLADKQLAVETRWSRQYHNSDGSIALHDSRFRDGSTTITARQVAIEWPKWPDHEKLDFCNALPHYKGRDLAKILRFLMRNGEQIYWQAVAQSIGTKLPTNEAVDFLHQTIQRTEPGQWANYFQALWLTRSANARQILSECLDRIWESEELMTADSFCNFVTFDAIWCIDSLLRLGEEPAVLAERYNVLLGHPSMCGDVIKWLAKYF